jgi:DNA-binding transcriptional LysR family regulator
MDTADSGNSNNGADFLSFHSIHQTIKCPLFIPHENALRRLPSMTALLAFEAAATHRSFTKAAEQLALTQSAVSKQVQALEQQLGRRLFERRGKAIALTLAGEQLMRQLPAWLSAGERLCGQPASRGSVGGPLKLAVLPTFGTQWLAPRLHEFLEQYPRVELTLESRVRPFDFSSTDFDAAIHYGAPEWPGAQLQRLFGEVTIAVAAPAIASKIKTARDALRQRWVLQTTRPQALADFTAFLKLPLPDAPALPPLHVEQFAMLVRIVGAGVGIGLVPERWVEPELAHGQLVALLGYAHRESAAYYVVTPHGRTTSPACAAFVRWVGEQAAADGE